MFLALLLLQAAVKAQTASPPKQTIFEDQGRQVSVHFSGAASAMVEFSSEIPAGWSFTVNVDGDQDGRWGSGHGIPPASVMSSPDYAFGQHGRTGKLCPQYVFTSFESDPSQAQVMSKCGELPSKGQVAIEEAKASGRVAISYILPVSEVSGIDQRHPSKYASGIQSIGLASIPFRRP
jgi:hypothetical protein